MIKDILNFINSFEEDDTDEKFRDYLKKVKPMSGAGILTLLNGCVSRIDEENCYLEVGVHMGCTLIASSLDHNNMCYGVDNFSGHNNPSDFRGFTQFKTIEEGLQYNIENFAKGNVKYFKEDFREFVKDRKDIEGKKVEVYMYDGDHGRSATHDGIKLYTDLLVDNAIVLLDDSANNDKGAVWGATNDILKNDKRFTLIREWVPSTIGGDMWCGMIALEFKR